MRIAPVVCLALLAGCGSSPPKRFYALNAIAPRQGLPQSSAAPSIQVASVDIPPVLDRQELVRRTSPNTIEISDPNRWGAPLGDMMQDVLTQDLLRRLPPGAVVPPQATAPPGTCRITLHILQFDADSTGTVVFDGSWTAFRGGSDTPLVSQHLTLTDRAAAVGFPGQVTAMSRLLAQVADDIVLRLARGCGGTSG